MEDFNDICQHWGKVEGRRKDQRKIDGVMSLIEDLGLGDIGFKGQMHMWSNNRGRDDQNVERLDRVLANDTWCSSFYKAQCPSHKLRPFASLSYDGLLTLERSKEF